MIKEMLYISYKEAGAMKELEVVTVNTRKFYQTWNKDIKNGKVIVVSEWGRPKAVLIPINSLEKMSEDCREFLEKLIFKAIISTSK